MKHESNEARRAPRVAVVGGLGREAARYDHPGVRYFGSPGDVGRGELVRLEHALRAGGIGRVVLRTRWNAHTSINRIRRVCKTLGIPVTFAR